MEAESKPASAQQRSDLGLCFRLLLLCPPRLHQCRQLLPHSCTHRLATGGLFGDGRTLFGSRFAFLLCPPGLLCSPDSGTCCRAHPATFLGTRWLSLAPVRWPTTPYRLGT